MVLIQNYNESVYLHFLDALLELVVLRQWLQLHHLIEESDVVQVRIQLCN